MKPSHSPHPAEPLEVLKRVNQVRGAHLQETGRDLEWGEIGRRLKWAPSTVTDVKGGRPLRVMEIARLAELLGCSPGWLAFAEGTMWGARAPQEPRVIGAVPYEDGIDSDRAIDQRAYQATPRPELRVAEGQPGRATSGGAPPSGAPSRGKRGKRSP